MINSSRRLCVEIQYLNAISLQRAENWMPIPEYEDLYHVSDLERVKTLFRIDKFGRRRSEAIMTPSINGQGYYILELYREGKHQTKLLHRLIGQAFIPNPENKKCINHKNSIRHDNSLSNLEWATYSDNNQHAFDFGKQVKTVGAAHPFVKLTEEKVLEIRAKYVKGIYGIERLSKEYGVAFGTIQCIIYKKTWKHI